LNLADIDIGSAGQLCCPTPLAAWRIHIFWLREARLAHSTFSTATIWAISTPEVIRKSCKPSAALVAAGARRYFNGTIYFVGNGDHVKGFSISNRVGKPDAGQPKPLDNGFSGRFAAHYRQRTNNAIAWVLQIPVPPFSTLKRQNLAQELYNSSQNSARDNPGNFVKFGFRRPPMARLRRYGERALSLRQ